MDHMTDGYLVTFKAPNGYVYEITCVADSEAEAVQSADQTLEYVERVGIKDYLLADGLSVRAPAELTVESAPTKGTVHGFGLAITDPSGNLYRK
jgi:hypothetical protein